MKALFWLQLALIAVAAPASVSGYRDIGTDDPVHTGRDSNWRQKAIELVQKAIDCLEVGVVNQVPEDSRLEQALHYLREKLTDLQDSSISISKINRFGFLQKVVDKIDEAVSKLPGGSLKDRLQQVSGWIHRHIESVRPSDIVIVNQTVRNRLNHIQQLIEAHKHHGDQFLRNFLNSKMLRRLVSQIPEPIQSEVRSQIAQLMERNT